jgi:1,4-alpha-glucan branching enzyme
VRFRLTPSFVLLAGVALTALGLLALPNERPTVREERARERAEATEALVRLVLPAEGAGSVAVAGDFNGWQTDQIFLEDPEGDGVFVGTLRLRPGSYGYMFVIDGERWVTDPYAVNHRDDGFGNRNAVLRID